jgi:imidazolonepropionase-like amidohydrolase
MWRSQFGASDVAAVVATAHGLGLPVAAHCHGHQGIADAVSAGVDTIEHCTFITDPGRSEPDPDALARIAHAGIAVSATLGRDLSVPVSPLVAENQGAIIGALRTLRRHGGTVVVGTDAGITPAKPHDILPHAVRELGEIGLRGTDLLATLTTVAADVCGVGDRKGRVRAGYDADLLAVAGDPVADPTALRAVRGVWRAGLPVAGTS